MNIEDNVQTFVPCPGLYNVDMQLLFDYLRNKCLCSSRTVDMVQVEQNSGFG